MAKLTEKQRAEILAELALGTTVTALAEKYAVSRTTIRNIREKSGDELKREIQQRQDENTKSVLAFLDSQRDTACNLISTLLDALNDPEKIREASLVKIATTLGIVIDKFTAHESGATTDERENNLFAMIAQSTAVNISFDEIPELAGQAHKQSYSNIAERSP